MFSFHIQLALLLKLSSTISKSGSYDKPSRNVIKDKLVKGLKGSQTTSIFLGYTNQRSATSSGCPKDPPLCEQFAFFY